MSDPEIDRRCNLCGASVRPHALFCPQCGGPIANQPKIPDPIRPNPIAANGSFESNPTVPLAHESPPDLPETRPLMDLSETRPLIPASAAVSDQTRAPLHRKRPRPRTSHGIEENVMGKIEKLRKVSSVVIDQAAYDPSLRFILVAAVLFLLFLFLLILSKLLG